MAKVCIICTEEVASGSPVADDAVIRAIRRAKQALNIAKNNELVVCSKDAEAHRKKRQNYERNLALYMVIAGIVLVLLVLVPIFTSGFSASALLIGVLLAALLVLLPVITSHTPALAGAASTAKVPQQGQKEKAKSAGKKAKK
jgi:hypothetical protein